MELAKYFDHTSLRPDLVPADIKRLCAEAVEYGFATVCVPPYFTTEAHQALAAYPAIKVCTVVGFPLGYSATAAKVEEIKRAIDEGAQELDVVVNPCAIKGGNWSFVRNDIDRMATSVHLRGKLIKVIFETGTLNAEEIKQLCGICNDLNVDFVKTSTGFNGEGATLEAVNLMRHYLNDAIKVKASGGIRTLAEAQAFIAAGAVRLGSSASVSIIKEAQALGVG